PPPIPPLFPYTTLFRSNATAGRSSRLQARYSAIEAPLASFACWPDHPIRRPSASLLPTGATGGDTTTAAPTALSRRRSDTARSRSEEHTSELHSLTNLV